MKKSFITEICIFLFILLFTYTSISKFLDYHRFVFQMQLAPVPFMKLVAPYLGWIVPTAESFLVVWLCLGLFKPEIRLWPLFLSVILLATFELYIAAMILSGLHLPCTCGGIISKMSWYQHLIFNAFFIIVGVIGLIQHKLTDTDNSKKNFLRVKAGNPLPGN
jgi:putative oxidoreductase